MATIDDIRLAFQNILQRSGTEVTDAELNSYVSAVNSGALTLAQARTALINSPEGQDVQDVVRLYQVVFGRVPDQAGLNFQVDALRGPANEQNIANGLAASPEFAARFGGNTVNTAFINAVYQNVLGRAPAASEVDFYLNSGFSAARIALAFSEAPEFRTRVDSAVATFLDAAGQGTAVYTGPLGGAGGIPTTPVPSIAFTTGVDNLVGTAANESFSGVIDTVTASNNTFTVIDTVNGGAGVDSLNVLLTSATAATTAVPVAGVSNIENFFLRNLDVDTDGTGTADAASTLTFDAAAVVGEQQVWNDRSTGAVSVTGLATGSTIGVRGDTNTSVGATTFTMATATDAVTIAIDGGVKGTGAITRNQTGEAAVTITSTGAANTVGVIDVDTATAVKAVTINATTALTASLAADYAAASTLTVNGAGAVNLSGAALSANITTINAAGSSGGLNVLASNTADLKFTGGSGNDRVALGATLTAADTIVGGAGTDTVAITGVDLTDAANVAQLNGLNTKVTGFEVLEFTGTSAATIAGGTGTGAFTNTEITKLLFNTVSTTADVVNSAGSTRTYAFGELNTGGATLNGAAGVTSFSVALEGIAGNGADVGTLTGNFTNAGGTQVGTGTINLLSTGVNDAAAPNVIASIAGTSNTSTPLTSTSVVITGGHDLTIGAAATNQVGFASSANVNASGFTGKLTIGGSNAQDFIVGGSGDDIINATTGGDTYTGGAGADVFDFDRAEEGSASALTTIADFVSGTDKINLNGLLSGTGEVVTTAVNVSAAPDFAGALNIAAAGTTANQVTYFQQGGNTFVVVDTDTGTTFGSGDLVIRLTGNVTLTANDFVL